MNAKLSNGKLLVADPSIIGDFSFTRAVVLLADHNDEGSVGFILNKPMSHDLRTFVPEISQPFSVFEGGPVDQDRLYYVHSRRDCIPNSKPISKELAWGGDFDVITTMINSGELSSDDIKFFLGYSGWSCDQLKDEIKQKTWIVLDEGDKKANISTSNDASFWKSKMMRLGGRYSLWANSPSHPNLN
ncbi:MAG: YqgE/AlgH family protein [Flavobacteriaceae bacterium]|nr:YqgE/AlgH family protein [Flavobacteriaceae bacterium]